MIIGYFQLPGGPVVRLLSYLDGSWTVRIDEGPSVDFGADATAEVLTVAVKRLLHWRPDAPQEHSA